MADSPNDSRPRDFDGEEEQTRDLAPENDNAEQDDADAQANTLADEAVGRSSDDFGLTDTEKVATGDDTDDAQDLVDHMNQMVTSGRIDMGAFRGEPNMDEEEGRYGPGADDTDPVSGEDQDYDPRKADQGLPEGEASDMVPLDELGLDEMDDDELSMEDKLDEQ